MDEKKRKLSELLHEAAETHHIVYRIVDGDDPDWASWYADWLIEHSEMPHLIGNTPVRSHLITSLVLLDREFTDKKLPGKWEDYYSAKLLEELSNSKS